MAHEGLVIFLFFLGALLLVGFYLGPNKEVRLVKRTEGKVMLLPSAVILFVLAIIIFTGVIG
ncbi:MAG: hypothetical protein E4H14_07895 [Candidatus Thorarchaeota archaeon]|nr:MAG: hypothetical protein E4H14_07895 [Candidatus Thorarchaeota archaeon]